MLNPLQTGDLGYLVPVTSAAHDVLPAASNAGNADFELGLDENSVSPVDKPGTHNDHLNRFER